MLTALDEALRRAREHYLGIGKEAHWRAFEARVLRPSQSGVDALPCDALADQLGFRTAADVASSVQVVRTRVKQLLREVVAESLDPGANIEDEMAHVRALLDV